MKITGWPKLVPAVFSPRKAASRHMRAADAARNARRWAEAAEQYRRALDHRPDAAGIWVQYGHALKEDGRVAAALEAYRTAAGLDPRSADTQLQLGHALKLQGRLVEAATAYAAAAGLDAGLGNAGVELEALGYGMDGQVLPPPLERDEAEDEEADDDALEEAVPSRPRRPTVHIPAPHIPPPTGVIRPSMAEGRAAEALLARHGLLPHVLDHLDAEFYAADQDLPDRGGDRLQEIIGHFCTRGLPHLAPLNERMVFDATFHEAVYPGPFRLAPADRYRHWLNRGIREGQAPNLTVWVQEVAGLAIRDLDQLDLPFHRAAIPGLVRMTDMQAVEWLAGGGLLDERLDSDLLEGRGADRIALLEAAARRAIRRGQPDLAMALMERVLVQDPLRRPLIQDYADRLNDQGQSFAATVIYRRLIDAGLEDWSTHVHLYAALRKQRSPRAAYEAAAAGARAMPEHPVLRRVLDEARLDLWHATDREYRTLARAGRVAEGQALVAGYAALATPPLRDERLPPRPVRAVALFGNLDLPQCRFYRVDQKIEQLERAGYEVTLYEMHGDLADFLAEMRRFQAVIFYRVAPLPGIIPAIQAARAMGLVTFYEIDDLLFLADEYPGPLEGYAGQITAEEHASLAEGAPLFLAALRMCDHALASTPTLARAMAPFVPGRAFVHRNGMGSDHEAYLDYEPPQPVPGQPVVIFYGSGTKAHKKDYQDLLEPALTEIARRHGAAVSFVMVGWLPVSDAFRAAAGDRLAVIEPSFDLHEYWGMLQQSDINLAVLSPSLMVDAKSEIKWMEAAMFGIPSVVSRTATHAEVIEDGATGFLCTSVAEWVAALDRLVRDAGLRRRVGLAAQQAVRTAYSIDALAGNIRGILESVSPPEPPPRQKVLVVNVFYAPQLHGGATRVVHDNILHLSRAHGDAFEIEVFTAVDGSPDEYTVASYPQDGIAVTGVNRSVEGETSGEVSDPRMAAIFRTHLETTRPDLVHFHCIQRLSVAIVDVTREMGIPYLITAHDSWWISDNQFLVDAWGRERTYDYAQPRRVLAEQGRAAFSRMQALRPALMGAAAVLGVSEPFSAIYRRCGVPNVRTVSNGLPPLVPLPRVPPAGDRVRLAHIGGMSRHKGYHLLRAVLSAGRFANLSLLVVDHAQAEGRTREERWGDVPVTFVAKRGQGEVTGLYAGIDVLVAPSIWAESYGLVTREALACGCWVVASDRGAIGTDVEDGVNGFVVDVRDGQALDAALRRIDTDPARFCQSPPARPLRRAEEQGEELAALYRSLKPARPPAPR